MKTKQLQYYDSREAEQFKERANQWIERLNAWKEFAEEQTGLAITKRDIFGDNLRTRIMQLAKEDSARQKLPANKQKVLKEAEDLYTKVYNLLKECWRDLDGFKAKPIFNDYIAFDQQDGFSLKDLQPYLKERFTYTAPPVSLEIFQATEKLQKSIAEFNDICKRYFLDGGLHIGYEGITINGNKVIRQDLKLNREFFCKRDLEALGNRKKEQILKSNEGGR